LQQVPKRSIYATRTKQLVTDYRALCCIAFYKHNTIVLLVQDDNVVVNLVRLPRRLYGKAVLVPRKAVQHDAQPSARSCLSEAKQRNFEIDIARSNKLVPTFSGKLEKAVTLPSLR